MGCTHASCLAWPPSGAGASCSCVEDRGRGFPPRLEDRQGHLGSKGLCLLRTDAGASCSCTVQKTEAGADGNGALLPFALKTDYGASCSLFGRESRVRARHRPGSPPCSWSEDSASPCLRGVLVLQLKVVSPRALHPHHRQVPRVHHRSTTGVARTSTAQCCWPRWCPGPRRFRLDTFEAYCAPTSQTGH